MDKILISVYGDIYKDDGTTVRPKRVLDILKDRYDIIFITNSNKEVNDNKNNHIKVVGPERTRLWNLKLINIILRNKFDLVYCSNDWTGFLTFYIFSLLLNYPVIFEAHSILSKEREEAKDNKILIRMVEYLERFVVKHSDYVIALSEDTFNFYREYNQNIKLIPVFIDEEKFKKFDGLNKLSDKSNVKTAGLIGPFNLTANANFLDFLYNNLDSFDDRIKFKIIGKCNKIIQSPKISYTGYIEDLGDYINEISLLDAVIIPSDHRTFGPLNKIIEPMSCSVPVFTTPEGAVGLYKVEDKHDILIFDEDELIEKLNELLFDDELMGKISLKARKTIENYYGQKSNGKLIMDVIDGLIEN